ncbi:hypothetical protein PtA15_13A358 [Puccinia triticina]|uniref:Secreted protein n=1 Tax=Puccinia triticina TaxID=208348 RepID=A0ABY7D2Y6_9BASI|nr:uncharacterized protein PtA15_13A358 [Puccinia triticina]WAQ90958.1 hypothetical protein PtA15_13A358 [Puccinia triticina]WAR61146.1 hypothetical protein PtB15_13B398 [Puccinia triticina]
MMITLSRPARTLLLVSLCLFVSMQVDALPTSPHSSGYSLDGAAGHRAAAVSRRHPSTGPSALARRSGNGLDLSVQLDLPILGSMGALNLGGQIDGFIPGMPYGVRSSLGESLNHRPGGSGFGESQYPPAMASQPSLVQTRIPPKYKNTGAPANRINDIDLCTQNPNAPSCWYYYY